jgi:hypothetical protein
MLDQVTQTQFASGRFLIRTFVLLYGNQNAREARAPPFPNAWREGSSQDWESWYRRVERAPERQNASSGCGRSATSVRNAAISSGDW